MTDTNDVITITKPEKGMPLYDTLDVKLTYQNFGSKWLGILRGTPEQIELAFNGLFNLGATNGDYQYYDHTQNVAIFWTDKTMLTKFFFNKVTFSCNPPKIVAQDIARASIRELQENHHENLLRFAFNADTFTVGTIRAERPDADMKDAIIGNAFKDKTANDDKKELTEPS